MYFHQNTRVMQKENIIYFIPVLWVFSQTFYAQKALRKAELQYNGGKYAEAVSTYSFLFKRQQLRYQCHHWFGNVTLEIWVNLLKLKGYFKSVPDSQIWNPEFYKIYGNPIGGKGEYVRAKDRVCSIQGFLSEEGNLLMSIDISMTFGSNFSNV